MKWRRRRPIAARERLEACEKATGDRDPLIAVDTQPGRLALARELGASIVIDASQVDAVIEIQKLGGVDYTVEAILRSACTAFRRRSREPRASPR